MIHPSNNNYGTVKSLANDPIQFEFKGKAAHAAACPEKGINALDGVIQLFNGINALRQHVTSDVRIHGIITDGGSAPNIVPDYAKANFFIRASKRSSCNQVTERIKNVARGAALITGAKVNISFFQNKIDNFLVNNTFDKIFEENLNLIGENFIDEIPEGLASTDAGNVSHVVPTIHPHIKIGSSKLAAHTPQFREAAISKQGDEALIIGAKALALTGLTLLTDKGRLNEIKDEFNRQHS